MDQRISTLAECFPDSVIRVDENMVTLYTEMPPVDAQRELDRLCDEWVKCSAGSELYIRLLCVKVAKLVRV
ncbi:MAG TPA: hypothetical protein PLW12_09265 [Methanothrix sp.]|nr:hypothetical protein [Methanothrix sp.]HPO89467.1 hypothetical protein [Methanothrix sp.]